MELLPKLTHTPHTHTHTSHLPPHTCLHGMHGTAASSSFSGADLEETTLSFQSESSASRQGLRHLPWLGTSLPLIHTCTCAFISSFFETVTFCLHNFIGGQDEGKQTVAAPGRRKLYFTTWIDSRADGAWEQWAGLPFGGWWQGAGRPQPRILTTRLKTGLDPDGVRPETDRNRSETLTGQPSTSSSSSSQPKVAFSRKDTTCLL